MNRSRHFSSIHCEVYSHLPPSSALISNLSYDQYRGVISLLSVQDGMIQKGTERVCHHRISRTNHPSLGDRIVSCHTRKKYEITELGIMIPEEVSVTSLHPGQVGYIACNMKESSEGRK